MSNAAKLCWRIFYWHFYAQRHAGRPLLGTVGRYKNPGGWTFWIRRFFFNSFQNLRGQLYPILPVQTLNSSYGPVSVLFYRAKKNAATTRGLLALMMAQASLGCLPWAHFAIWREISHNFQKVVASTKFLVKMTQEKCNYNARIIDAGTG